MRIAILIGVLAAAAACSRTSARGEDRGSVATHQGTGSSSGNTSGSGSAPATAPRAKVFLEGTAGTTAVDVEVVQSPGLVQKGLMYRKYMDADAGMLFLMGDVDDHHFWMKNTLISLDIMFITSDLQVAGILENMRPHDTNSKGVGKPSLYVLEVNGGYARAHGISAGTRVRFEGVEAAAR
jgi:uncharacterized membrane protein (UPF0127 family)